MATVNPLSVKNPLSISMPCNFVRDAKRLLEEASEKKTFIKEGLNGVSADHSRRTAEYYDLIDATVQDQDMLDILRLRSLLIENLKIADEEIKAISKKDVNEVGDAADKVLPNKDLKSADVVSKARNISRDDVKAKKNIRNNTTNKSSVFARLSAAKNCGMVMKDNSSQTSPSKILPDKQVQAHDSHKDDPLSGSIVFSKEFIKRTEEICPPISSNVGISSKIQQAYHKKLFSGLNMRQKGESVNTANEFCELRAIPLAPPNRQKWAESNSEMLNNNRTTFALKTSPDIINNRNVVLIETCQEQKAPKKLVIQKLPCINIMPSVTRINNNKMMTYKMSSLLKEEVPSQETNEKLHFGMDMVSPPLSQSSLPSAGNENDDMQRGQIEVDASTKTLLSRLAIALKKCKEKLGGDVSSESSRKSFIFSPIQEHSADVCDTNWNESIYKKQLEKFYEYEAKLAAASPPSSPVEKVDVMIQVQEETVNKEMRDIAVSAELCDISANTHEASLSLSYADMSVQTDLMGLLSCDIVVRESSLHSPNCSCAHCLQPSVIRSSTPFDDVRAEKDQEKIAEFDGERNVDCIHKVDVSVETVGYNMADLQGFICEIADKEIQVDPQILEQEILSISGDKEENVKTSRATMTVAAQKCEVGVQSESIMSPETEKHVDESHGRTNVGIQSDLVNASTSSINTSLSQSNKIEKEFRECMSDGEINLPLNLKLLFLIENHLRTHGATSSSSDSNENVESGNENMLSEGEIAPLSMQTKEMVNHPQINEYFMRTTDTSLDFIPEKLSSDSSCSGAVFGRPIASSNPSILKSSSELSSSSFSCGQMLSEGEVVIPSVASSSSVQNFNQKQSTNDLENLHCAERQVIEAAQSTEIQDS